MTPVRRWTLIAHHAQSSLAIAVIDHPDGPAVLVEAPGQAARMLVGQLASRWLDATSAIASTVSADVLGGGGTLTSRQISPD
jgi:hypothetical protein